LPVKQGAASVEESDRAVRLARITALAEEVFGSEEKAFRWLRKPKRRFGSRTPLEMLGTEAGARLVEEMLYQIDEGMAA
jgi:putative toxin-antitoxin system antitoxin component (TIGR02293 family)